MRDRLRRVARLVGAVLVTVVVAGAAGAAVIYATGPSGLVSCVPAAAPATDPIPRWVIAAGIPAVVAAFIGSFFALGAQYVLGRLIGIVLAFALGGVTFYAVYLLLPAACRP
jgi:hypothetical protein